MNIDLIYSNRSFFDPYVCKLILYLKMIFLKSEKREIVNNIK